MFHTHTATLKYNAENIEKFLKDVDKYSIGLDEWMHRFASVHEGVPNYPPYNLIKESSVSFRLEIALAGFNKKDISVTTEWNKLFVEAKRDEENDTEYIHQGLAKRAFTRTWTLSDDVVVGDVSFRDGLLVIKLNRVIPEHQRKKEYKILDPDE